MSHRVTGASAFRTALRASLTISLFGLALPASSQAVTTTFTNPTEINLSNGPADVFPSTINAGQAGTVNKATAKLKSISHTNFDDIDVVLVGPGGQKVMLMSDACAGDSQFKTYTFEDGAPAFLADGSPCANGTYLLTNHEGPAEDFSGVGGPAPPYVNNLATFNGGPSNGAWSLFAVDDGGAASGGISGWDLTLDITLAPGAGGGAGGGGGVGGLTGNAFLLGKVTRLSSGAALILGTFPGSGTVVVEDAKTAKKTSAVGAQKRRKKRRRRVSRALIKKTTAQVRGAVTISLPIRPTARARRALRRRRSHSLNVDVKVTYTPTGGTPASQSKKVKLKRKVKRKRRKRVG